MDIYHRGCDSMRLAGRLTMIIGACGVAATTTLLAVPLSELILQEDAKLTARVDAWQKQCSDKPTYDENCMKQRYELCGDLGKFVALVNDDVVMLRKPAAPNIDAADKRTLDAHLRHMEYLIDVATHRMRCLGRSPSDPTCKAEAASLEKRKSQQ